MSVIYQAGAPAEAEEARPIARSLLRGALGRCPKCGEGRMFHAFLKVSDQCPHCGEDLHHHRADDAPPYLTMFIVGHVVVAILLWAEVTYTPPLWVHAMIFIPAALIMSLVLLPRIKGALVALQWALRMHGFDARDEGPDPAR